MLDMYTSILRKLIILGIIFSCLGCLAVCRAATYYIDGNLADDCDGTSYYYDVTTRTRNPGPGQIAWNDFHSANITLVAGDIVYIRGGTSSYQDYSIGVHTSNDEGIEPDNSGTSGNYITYATYANEKVHLVGQADLGVASIGININEKSYIKVTGVSKYNLKLSKMKLGIQIGGYTGADNIPTNYSNSNEVCYVWVYDSYESDSWSNQFQGNTIWKKVQYNYVHDCKFEKHGWLGPNAGENEGDILAMGLESGATHATDYQDYFNVVENCEFLYAGHSTFSLHGAKYSTIRNNYFHNEPWYSYDSDLYSYRNLICNGYYVDTTQNSGWSIFEGNRVGYAGPNITTGNYGGGGIKLGLSDMIFRHNAFFSNQRTAFYLQPYTNGKSNENYIYNNTFFSNGYYSEPGSSTTYHQPFMFGYNDGTVLWDRVHSNIIKNNLFYKNANIENEEVVWTFANTNGYGNLTDCQGSGPNQGNNAISNNFNGGTVWSTESDPLFRSEATSDKSSWALPNLLPSLSSPAINNSVSLTQANGSGTSSTTLIVDDAHYFQDGKFGSASGCNPSNWPSGVDIEADWIAIGAVTNVVQISSIDYSTNTITLSQPMSWNDSDSIYLYKRSDGTRVLYGSAPDQGAYEYMPGGITGGGTSKITGGTGGKMLGQ